MASLNAVLFVIIALASMILATDLFHGVAEAKRPIPSPPYCEPGSGYGSRDKTNDCPRAPMQDMYQGTAVSAHDSLRHRPHKPASFNANSNDLHAPAPPKVNMKGKWGKKKSEYVPPPPPVKRKINIAPFIPGRRHV